MKFGRKGSAEAELSDGEPKYAKIRPMRVEMFLRVRTGNPRGCPNFWGTRKNIATDSGETTRPKMILAVLNFNRNCLDLWTKIVNM